VLVAPLRRSPPCFSEDMPTNGAGSLVGVQLTLLAQLALSWAISLTVAS
jgi:hypothetical protein